MKWVPVSKSDEPAKPEKEEKPEKSEEPKGKKKGKGEGKGAGKSEAKGSGKSDAKGGGKAEAKSAGKGDKGGEKGEKGAKAEGKGDSKGGGKRGKGDSEAAGAKGSGKWDAKEEAKDKGKGRGGPKGEPKGDAKGGGKGRGDKGKGKGGGKGKGAKGDEGSQPRVRTVQEVEAEMATGQATKPLRRARGGESLGKQAIEAKGDHCEVRKHSSMGCCVVTMESGAAREVVMRHVEKQCGHVPGTKAKTQVGSVMVQVQRHQDKSTHTTVETDIFVAWGHRAEKESPLAVEDIAEAFDKLFTDGSAANVQAGLPPPQVQAGLAPAAALGTLSTMPGQLLTGRPPAVPPPPAHLPTVGPRWSASGSSTFSWSSAATLTRRSRRWTSAAS